MRRSRRGQALQKTEPEVLILWECRRRRRHWRAEWLQHICAHVGSTECSCVVGMFATHTIVVVVVVVIAVVGAASSKNIIAWSSAKHSSMSTSCWCSGWRGANRRRWSSTTCGMSVLASCLSHLLFLVISMHYYDHYNYYCSHYLYYAIPY